HAAGGQLGDVFVIGLGEGFGVDDALVEFFVQLAEVCLGGRGGVVVNDGGAVLDDDRTVVRVAVQELGRVLQAEVTPVFAQDGVGDVLGAVLHRRVLGDVALEQVEVLVHRADLGVARPFQNADLNPERFVVVGGGHI